MDTETTNALIDMVKSKCYITDNSQLTIQRLNNIIDDAQIKINELVGVEEIDLSKPCKARELFLNYCFYVWNDKSIKEFEENYISDILKLRHEYMVKEETQDEKL